MTYQQIEIKHLDRSALNVRKTDSHAAMEELKASIVAHGLMQNLVVVPAKKGRFEVIAGGRRLEALTQLQTEGTLPDDHAVPCRIADPSEAAELSLAENTVREAMHPADEFEAFASLIGKGNTAEQVAQRFGVSRRTVEGRMRLARVAPELIREYREGELTLDALMAFTVTDDHQKQLSAYESLSDWDLKRPDSIRDALTEELVEAKTKMAQFVTLQTYLDAGGTTRTDLFGDDVYFENPELLEALVAEKLKLVEKELVAEGWKWVEVAREKDWKATQGCTRLEPETTGAPEALLSEMTKLEAEQLSLGEQLDATEDDEEIDRLNDHVTALEGKLDELADQIASYARFNPEQTASGGCYAYIGRDGKLVVEKGLLRREDSKEPEKPAVVGEDGEPLPDKPKGIPESLKRDLEAYRLGAAQAEIAMHPAIAFDLLVFKVAANTLGDDRVYDGPQVSFHRNRCGNASADASGFIDSLMEPMANNLPVEWLKAKSEASQFAEFQKLSFDQKQALLAYCVAVTLLPKLGGEGEPTAYDVALSQTGANVAEYWRPGAATYLSRVPKDQLIEIGRVVFLGGDSWAGRMKDAKKAALVTELDKAFAKSGNPDTIDKLKNWLPTGMAFGTVPSPKPTKTKKAKKAA